MNETVMERDRHWERAHGFAQWLSDRLPILVPSPASERQMRLWGQWADRRRVRRTLAGMVVFVLALALVCWISTANIDHERFGDAHGLFHRIVALVTAASYSFQLGVMLFWSNLVYMFAGSSREDVAMLDYGVPYDKLTTAQRREMLVRQRAKMLVMCFRGDEQQSLQLERAERAAYRLLRRALVAIVIVAWAAYLIAPERVFRRLLQWGWLMRNDPLMLTWLAMGLIVLPVLIRLWVEPDEMGEPKVVAMEEA